MNKTFSKRLLVCIMHHPKLCKSQSLSQHITVLSRIPQSAAGWLTMGAKPKKPLLFPWLQHLTRGSILYITLRAPGSSCSQSEAWSTANSFVLPTHSQTACPGCPLPLPPAEGTSLLTWAIQLNIAVLVLQYERRDCVLAREMMGRVWEDFLFLQAHFGRPQNPNQMFFKGEKSVVWVVIFLVFYTNKVILIHLVETLWANLK